MTSAAVPSPFAAPTVSGLLAFGAATVLLVVLMLALEALVRRRGWRHETTRRIAHVLACIYGLFSHSVLPLWLFVLACSAFVVLLVLSRRMALLTSVHTTRRASLGEVYLPAGIIIAALAGAFARQPSVFVATILILALADVAAGVTGDLLAAESKTRRGSLAFLVVAFAIVLACGFGPLPAIAVAVVTAVVERVSSRGTDNLTVPLAAGALLALLPAF